MNAGRNGDKTEARDDDRREYIAPRLVRYGDLRQLTAGQGSVAFDMEMGSDFKD